MGTCSIFLCSAVFVTFYFQFNFCSVGGIYHQTIWFLVVMYSNRRLCSPAKSGRFVNDNRMKLVYVFLVICARSAPQSDSFTSLSHFRRVPIQSPVQISLAWWKHTTADIVLCPTFLFFLIGTYGCSVCVKSDFI